MTEEQIAKFRSLLIISNMEFDVEKQEEREREEALQRENFDKQIKEIDSNLKIQFDSLMNQLNGS